MAEMCILWQNDLQQEQVVSSAVSNEYLPYAFQHPRVCLGLCGLIQDNLYAQIGGKLYLYYSILSFCSNFITLKAFLIF